MPITTDHHHHQHSSFSSISRSIFAARRDQVHAMDAHPHLSASHDRQLESFQRHVSAALAALSSTSAPELLSLQWIRTLLDSFFLIHEEFGAVLFTSSSLVDSLPALRRSISDHLDRTVKALDLCNAIRDGIDQVKQWKNTAEIAVAALDPNHNHHLRSVIGEGQIRRAKKSLSDLAVSMSEPDPLAATVHRNRSFAPSCRTASAAAGAHHRSQTWSVSRSWSAAKQLQAIGAKLNAPRAAEIAATAGLAVTIYTMGIVLHFAMWALVAAIPCQDRGIQTHSSALPPRCFAWSAGILVLYERISEESRKRDRRNCGLLKEIDSMERRGRRLMEVVEGDGNGGGSAREEEVEGLKGVCEGLSEGLEPLERRVREVFHRIVKSRSEGLDCLSHRH